MLIVYKYVDQKRFDCIKRPTGVTLEVNVRNALNVGNETDKQGVHHSFETQSPKVKNRGTSDSTKIKKLKDLR